MSSTSTLRTRRFAQADARWMTSSSSSPERTRGRLPPRQRAATRSSYTTGRRSAVSDATSRRPCRPSCAASPGAGDRRLQRRVRRPGRRPRDRRLPRDDRTSSARAAPRAATTSPSREPTTGSGTPWRSSPSATPRRSSPTTRTTSSTSSAAWLGPGYQVTSQINVVNPGGTAQTAHRDYHLGFQSDRDCCRVPDARPSRCRRR